MLIIVVVKKWFNYIIVLLKDEHWKQCSVDWWKEDLLSFPWWIWIKYIFCMLLVWWILVEQKRFLWIYFKPSIIMRSSLILLNRFRRNVPTTRRLFHWDQEFTVALILALKAFGAIVNGGEHSLLITQNIWLFMAIAVGLAQFIWKKRDGQDG